MPSACTNAWRPSTYACSVQGKLADLSLSPWPGQSGAYALKPAPPSSPMVFLRGASVSGAGGAAGGRSTRCWGAWARDHTAHHQVRQACAQGARLRAHYAIAMKRNTADQHTPSPGGPCMHTRDSAPQLAHTRARALSNTMLEGHHIMQMQERCGLMRCSVVHAWQGKDFLPHTCMSTSWTRFRAAAGHPGTAAAWIPPGPQCGTPMSGRPP